MRDVLHQAGMGPRASALVAGFTHLHRELEQELAKLKGTQDCLLFPTGERVAQCSWLVLQQHFTRGQSVVMQLW